MANHTYNCPYCEYSSTTTPFIAHLMNHHFDELKKSDKISLKVAIKCQRYIPFRMKQKNEMDTYYVCYGCKKFWNKKALADSHTRKCLHKTEHTAFLTSLLDAQTTTDPDEIQLNLQKEVQKLTRKIERLEFELLENQEKADQFDALISIIYKKTEEAERDMWREELKGESPNVQWENYL